MPASCVRHNNRALGRTTLDSECSHTPQSRAHMGISLCRASHCARTHLTRWCLTADWHCHRCGDACSHVAALGHSDATLIPRRGDHRWPLVTTGGGTTWLSCTSPPLHAQQPGRAAAQRTRLPSADTRSDPGAGPQRAFGPGAPASVNARGRPAGGGGVPACVISTGAVHGAPCGHGVAACTPAPRAQFTPASTSPPTPTRSLHDGELNPPTHDRVTVRHLEALALPARANNED